MRRQLLIPAMLQRALTGEPLKVSGTGSQYRKLVYVGDIARAHVLAMQEGAAGKTYNLEGSRKVTVLEVANAIKDLVGNNTQIAFEPERQGDFAGMDISNRRAIEELGWSWTWTSKRD